MECTRARQDLIARLRGRLSAEAARDLDAHLAQCAACAAEMNVERELDRALSERLPRYAASDALLERLRDRSSSAADARAHEPVRRRTFFAATALSVAALALGVVFVLRPTGAIDPLAHEAVNDHLRMLYAEHAVEIPSGGIHQVKPWFEGKLDFAPVVAFPGDDEFPLQGGSVAYFIDRKAAAYVYKFRLHVITLFVFRSEGLPWSGAANSRPGLQRSDVRGFHAVLWRSGDLGYALVSDVDPAVLARLGAKIRGTP